MVLIDATTLLLFLSPLTAAPRDSETNEPIEFAQERVHALIQSFERQRAKIIVPAPALSEVLVRAGPRRLDYVRQIERRSVFRVEPFEGKAALEVAIMTRDDIDSGNKKTGVDGTWAKIKYDRQIVAIAKVCGVEAIYSDDRNVRSFAARFDIRVVRLSECPVPEEARQGKLALEANHGRPSLTIVKS